MRDISPFLETYGIASSLARFHDVPVGVPPQVTTGQRVLSALYQVDKPREGCLQASGLQSGLQAVGPA